MATPNTEATVVENVLRVLCRHRVFLLSVVLGLALVTHSNRYLGGLQNYTRSNCERSLKRGSRGRGPTGAPRR